MKMILWDFDGTLAYRDGGWTTAVADALASILPDLGVTRDEVRPHLQTGFPWHSPETPHTNLDSPTAWWDHLGASVLSRVLSALSAPVSELPRFVDTVRQVYCSGKYWHAYPDSLAVLRQLRELGWSNRILSNHVPELSSIVDAVGLGSMIERIHNSAETGFEKPNREAFRFATEVLPASSTVWMVGDSLAADVRGAERAGLQAILVRRSSTEVRWQTEELTGIIGIVQ